MGRHSTPPSPEQPRPGPSRALLVAGLALVLAVVAVVAAAFMLRGDDDTAQPVPVSPAATSTTSATGSASASPSTSTAIPTLAFRLVGTSHLTIRIPGGRTLVSKTFHRGDGGVFSNDVLQVVVGNSAAVNFMVNGKPRPRGDRGEVETFVVRRR